MKIQDLKANPKNPRTITDKRKAMLRKALLEFGDLSGFVYNAKTKHLVSGHQRKDAFDADAVITIQQKYKKPTKNGTTAVGFVELNGERFSYREVLWDEKREKAATIAANKSAGEWDNEILSEWLTELSDDLDLDLDLTMFEDDEMDKMIARTTTVKEHERVIEQETQFIVAVQCKNENEQARLFQELSERGLECKLIT